MGLEYGMEGGWVAAVERGGGGGGKKEEGDASARRNREGGREVGTYHRATELPTRDTSTQRVLRDGDLLVHDSIGEVVLSAKKRKREGGRKGEGERGELRAFRDVWLELKARRGAERRRKVG